MERLNFTKFIPPVDTKGNMEDEMENSCVGRTEQKIILKERYDWFISEECKRLIQTRGQK